VVGCLVVGCLGAVLPVGSHHPQPLLSKEGNRSEHPSLLLSGEGGMGSEKEYEYGNQEPQSGAA
jgi:hypothetical protein